MVITNYFNSAINIGIFGNINIVSGDRFAIGTACLLLDRFAIGTAARYWD